MLGVWGQKIKSSACLQGLNTHAINVNHMYNTGISFMEIWFLIIKSQFVQAPDYLFHSTQLTLGFK